MIFVTGDTHRVRDIDKLNIENFPEQKYLNRDDYVIIAGDFGGLWTGDEKDEEVLRLHEERNYTTLFVAGNHENHDLLNMFPVQMWHGGKVHKICEHVIHLMNGQVYEIDGKTFFVMGGATSVDKIFREEGISWWPQEEPELLEMREALDNLEKYDNKVDYIITHTTPELVRKNAFETASDFIEYSSRVEQFLDVILQNISYKKWFTGHIHIDREFKNYKLRVLYQGIVKI